MMSESVAVKGVSSRVCGKGSKCFRSFRGRRSDRICDRKGLPPAGPKDCRHSPVAGVCEKTVGIFTQQLSGSASPRGEESRNQFPRAYDAIVATHRPTAISLLLSLGVRFEIPMPSPPNRCPCPLRGVCYRPEATPQDYDVSENHAVCRTNVLLSAPSFT